MHDVQRVDGGRRSSGRSVSQPVGRSVRLGVAIVFGVALIGACAPTTPSGPPPPPGPPVITRFVVDAERTEAPVVATFGWTVSDPNGDLLVCRLDSDGDGTTDHEIIPCRSTDSVLAHFTTAGTRTATLTVDDGSSPPVTASTDLVVGDGPAESFEITLRLDPGMRSEFRGAFEDAAARWESVIVAGESDQRLDLPAGLLGWVPGYAGTVDDVLIDARDTPMDGPRGTLGMAGGLLIRPDRWQPYWGVMEFDTADLDMLLADGRLEDVILHEMGHVLGLGGSWLLSGFVTDALIDPAYTGRAGVAAYQELGGARYVPLENEGGVGTIFGHWRETTFGSELMTGFINRGAQPMSRLTVAALADLGYGVELSAADPYTLPGAAAVARAAQQDTDDDHDDAEHLHTEPIEPFLDGLPTS